MTEIGKLLIVLGLIMIVAGTALWLLGRAGFRGLPGDIAGESENFRVYFPIATCLVLSVALTALLWLWHWWMTRKQGSSADGGGRIPGVSFQLSTTPGHPRAPPARPAATHLKPHHPRNPRMNRK